MLRKIFNKIKKETGFNPGWYIISIERGTTQSVLDQVAVDSIVSKGPFSKEEAKGIRRDDRGAYYTHPPRYYLRQPKF
jgi:uncharacterized protein (UPF0248 family)